MRAIKIILLQMMCLLGIVAAYGNPDCSDKLGRFLTAVSQPADPLSLAPYGRVAVVTNSAFKVLQTQSGSNLCLPPELWQSLKQNAFAVTILAEPGEVLTTPSPDIRILSMTAQDLQSPIALDKAIDQQPILAFGASDKDIALLEYTGLSTPSLVIVLQNKAYPQQKLLQKAKAQGWVILGL